MYGGPPGQPQPQPQPYTYGQQNPYGQQAPYGQQVPFGPYGVPPGAAPGNPNGMAITAFITGAFGLFCLLASLVLVFVGLFGIISSVLAIVFGHIALSRIKRTGETGRGMAIAGLVTGYIGVSLWIVAVVIAVIAFVVLSN
ncbi:DUF4190 domain-containing protein [Spirillospora sp. NPDC052269]